MFIRIWKKYVPGRLLRTGRLLILVKIHGRTIIRDRTFIREVRVYEKTLTGQLQRAPVAKQCNFFQKKLHQQELLDAKRKVMMCQVSTTTHLAMGRDQKLSGHNLPPPRSDRVKLLLEC